MLAVLDLMGDEEHIMTNSNLSLDRPQQLAERGERIYATRYRDSFERQFAGQFVAIDVISGNAAVAEFPEEALEKALDSFPNPLLHLICIGESSAFAISRMIIA